MRHTNKRAHLEALLHDRMHHQASKYERRQRLFYALYPAIIVVFSLLFAILLLSSCGVARDTGTCPSINNRFFFKNH